MRRKQPPLTRAHTPRRRLGTEYLDKKWEKRCRFFCKCSGFFTCFLFGGNDSGNGNDFSMVARVLSDYFEDDGSLDIGEGKRSDINVLRRPPPPPLIFLLYRSPQRRRGGHGLPPPRSKV